jgi:hypothetical protein
MKVADGNNQLGTGENSITTPPRRNIPMTHAKYGGSTERIFKILITLFLCRTGQAAQFLITNILSKTTS